MIVRREGTMATVDRGGLAGLPKNMFAAMRPMIIPAIPHMIPSPHRNRLVTLVADSATLEAVEGSIEQDISPAMERFAADSSRKVMDLAEIAVESQQGDGVWSLPDKTLGLFEENSKNRRIGAPSPEIAVTTGGDGGGINNRPGIYRDVPGAPAGTETSARPPLTLFGRGQPGNRPFGSGAGLRTSGGAPGVGWIFWCPVYHRDSNAEICQECEFFTEDVDSENQCSYYDEL